MGFIAGLGCPTQLGIPSYYMHGFHPYIAGPCSCDNLHGQTHSYGFNGTSSKISVGGPSGCQTSGSAGVGGDFACSNDKTLSVGAWIKSNDVTSSTIISKGTASAREYALYFDSSDKLIFRIYDEGCYNSGSGDNWIQQKSDSAQNGLEDAWHWIVATYDATEANGGITLYLDGAALASTGSENNGYDYATPSGSGIVWGYDLLDSSPLGGYFDGEMYDMTVWNAELNLATIQDLYNSGNSTIYQYDTNSTWTGVSDMGYTPHYTDQAVSGAVDHCADIIVYYPGVTGTGSQAKSDDYGCSRCAGTNTAITGVADRPGSWTPNTAYTGVTEKIRIWIQNNTDIAVGEWSNQATGDTAVDAEQGTGSNQAALSNDGTSYGLDFDGTDNFYEFKDA